MKAYVTLTPRGQARRLRCLAWNALQQYALEVARLRLVTNDFNGIFRVDTTDGRKLILRVTLPEGGHDADHVTAEMDWLAALARDTNLNVPRPLPARNGLLFVEAEADGVPEPRLCEVFSWVPGKLLADELSEANIASLGELLARLHLHARSYRPPASLSLLHFDRPFPFPEPMVLFDEPYAALFPPERREVFERAIAWTQAAIDRLKASGEPMRILHNDLHQWNVLNFHGMLSPIDFEDLMLGWPVQDIATTLYYLPAGNYTALRAALQAGYTRCSPWPERCPGEIDAFIAARGFGLANFILNDPNPNWKNQAGEFIAGVERRLRSLLEANHVKS
jgi:Ser/Thr protein kinase RdoA (MazF antagonist)